MYCVFSIILYIEKHGLFFFFPEKMIAHAHIFDDKILTD